MAFGLEFKLGLRRIETITHIHIESEEGYNKWSNMLNWLNLEWCDKRKRWLFICASKDRENLLLRGGAKINLKLINM